MTFEQAKARYVHRFTMEHVPEWASQRRNDGTYYAPQYATDAEWFANTLFPPNNPFALGRSDKSCYSSNPSWPLGTSLTVPFGKALIHTCQTFENGASVPYSDGPCDACAAERAVSLA